MLLLAPLLSPHMGPGTRSATQPRPRGPRLGAPLAAAARGAASRAKCPAAGGSPGTALDIFRFLWFVFIIVFIVDMILFYRPPMWRLPCSRTTRSDRGTPTPDLTPMPAVSARVCRPLNRWVHCSGAMSEEKFKFIESGSKSVWLLCDAFCKTWYFSWNFGVKTWFDVGKWGIGRAGVRPDSFYHSYTPSSCFIFKWEKVWDRRLCCLTKVLFCYIAGKKLLQMDKKMTDLALIAIIKIILATCTGSVFNTGDRGGVNTWFFCPNSRYFLSLVFRPRPTSLRSGPSGDVDRRTMAGHLAVSRPSQRPQLPPLSGQMLSHNTFEGCNLSGCVFFMIHFQSGGQRCLGFTR